MTTVRLECHAARRRIHALLDGDPLDAGARRALDDHRAACVDCAELEAELRELQQGLRALPQPAFPDEALGEVFARTSRPATRRRGPWARSLDWRVAVAAAAVLAVAVFLGVRSDRPGELDPAEIAQARDEARLVLELTASALKRSQQAAFDQVVVGEVSPVLGRIPVRLPAGAEAVPRNGS